MIGQFDDRSAEIRTNGFGLMSPNEDTILMLIRSESKLEILSRGCNNKSCSHIVNGVMKICHPEIRTSGFRTRGPIYPLQIVSMMILIDYIINL